MRLDANAYYLNIAKAVAERSTCLRRQYGAVIVSHEVIIATGYNGGVRGGINCCDVGHCPRENMPHNSGDYSICFGVHAEQNAIIAASRNEMLDSKMYLYGIENGQPIMDIEPCPICKKLIANAGISKLVTITGIVDVKDKYIQTNL